MSAATTLHPGVTPSRPIALRPVVWQDCLGTVHLPDRNGRRTRCDRVALAKLAAVPLEHDDRVCKACKRGDEL